MEYGSFSYQCNRFVLISLMYTSWENEYVHALVTGNRAIIIIIYSYPMDGSQHIREVHVQGVGVGGGVPPPTKS